MSFPKWTGFGAFAGNAPLSIGGFVGGVWLINFADTAVQVIPGVSRGKVRLDYICIAPMNNDSINTANMIAPMWVTTWVLAAHVSDVTLEAFLSQMITGAGNVSPGPFELILRMGARMLWCQQVGMGVPDFSKDYTFDDDTLHGDEGETVFILTCNIRDGTGPFVGGFSTWLYQTVLGGYDYDDKDTFKLR